MSSVPGNVFAPAFIFVVIMHTAICLPKEDPFKKIIAQNMSIWRGRNISMAGAGDVISAGSDILNAWWHFLL